MLLARGVPRYAIFRHTGADATLATLPFEDDGRPPRDTAREALQGFLDGDGRRCFLAHQYAGTYYVVTTYADLSCHHHTFKVEAAPATYRVVD